MFYVYLNGEEKGRFGCLLAALALVQGDNAAYTVQQAINDGWSITTKARGVKSWQKQN